MIFNDQPVLGIVPVADGVAMLNHQPVIGVHDADEVLFRDHRRTVGIDVLEDAGPAVHNALPVLGAFAVTDDRTLHNNQPVIPVHVLSGEL